MADEKKRYWLKLEKDFLDSKYIKIIKGVPNGTDYILFYLALMLASVDTVGHLRFTELVPYNEQMLASLTGTNIDIVRSAMKMFQDLGMIRILEDGTIFMPEVPRLTGKESESAERVRLFRERQKQKALQCNNDVTECNDNKEKEKEEEKQRTENREQQEEHNTCGEVSSETISASPVFISLPKIGSPSQPNAFHNVTEDDIKRYEDVYPGVDVRSELKKMNLWLDSNPANRKKNVKAFIARWLAKSQDRSRGDFNGKPVEKKHAGSKEGYSVDITKYDTI
jgi:predicted phage replisome organizer